MNPESKATAAYPRPWKYLLGAFVTLAIVIPLLPLFNLAFLRPDMINPWETTMNKLCWIGLPVLMVAFLFGGRWVMVTQQVKQQQAGRAAQAEKNHSAAAAVLTEQGKREYVLEVMGLGVTLDKFRQGKLWEELQHGLPYQNIWVHDAEKYDWTNFDKMGTSGNRTCDTLENGAWDTVSYWGVPAFNASPPIYNKDEADGPTSPNGGFVASADSTGMLSFLFVIGPRQFSERPDQILNQVFTFFDENPDIPYVIVTSADGMTVRDRSRAKGSLPLQRTGYYVPEMPDASTLFVLARRERVEAIRPYAYDDIDYANSTVEAQNRDGVARRLYLAYLDLMSSVPMPEKILNPHALAQRQPLISEWLPEAAKFGVRQDIRSMGAGSISFLSKNHAGYHPPSDWKPTPWFPVPWNKFQLKEFDSLPSMGFIHRPVFVNMSDQHGKPLARRDLRKQALWQGWQQALQTLPEAERSKGPARLIAATGNNVEQRLALEGVLHDYAAQGGPEIDSGKTSQFIDTDLRLGNTGATTLFMQMAIGVMGSYRAGGASAAINLRDPHEASIIFISPPSDEKRKAQAHADGTDVFRHRGTPAIDPKNYEVPSSR